MNSGRQMAISNIATKLDDILMDIDSLREEEETYFENLPESVQESEKGEQSAESIEWLEKAHHYLSKCFDCLEIAIG